MAPKTFMDILNIYSTSFYGSSLWDLYSQDVERIYKSWNVTVRNVFGLPWTTHRYFIESISGCPHPKTFLSSRFVKFVDTLTSSKKTSIRYLASLAKEDRRTLCGRTLDKIKMEIGGESFASLTPKAVKDNLKYFPVPEIELWRVDVLLDLMNTRRGKCSIADFNSVEIEKMIDDICSS